MQCLIKGHVLRDVTLGNSVAMQASNALTSAAPVAASPGDTNLGPSQ